MNQKLVLKRSVIAVAMAVAAQAAFAQEAQAPIQKVFVTGSNIKRADKEGSSPVQTVSAKQIAATGANTVSELLHSIPAFGSGASVDGSDGGFSNGASTASLRGLGSSSTLILLNGRRITASAYADPNQGKSAVYDLNTIPISAIERVEIFKDGASAVYGSDAIAGVINFITKSDFNGLQLSANISANDDGEYKRENVNGVWGFGDLEQKGWSGFVAFDAAKRHRTTVKEQKDVENDLYRDINTRLNPFSSSLSASPFFYKETKPGSMAFYNNYANRASVINQVNCDKSQQLVGDRNLHNLTAIDTLVGRTFCNFDTNEYNEVQGKGEDANVLSKFTFKLNNDITAFVEASVSRTERYFTAAPRAIRSTAPTTVFTNGGIPSQFQIVLPVGHPDNPFTDARSAVGFRLVNSTNASENINESYRLVAGLQGSVKGWDWETALLWNRGERTERGYGYLYLPTMRRIMTENRTLAATMADPTATRDTENRGFAQVKQIDAKASTSFGKLPGGEIGLALGGEIRQEQIGLTPDLAVQRGDIIGLANSTADGSRVVKSAFVELRTPFFSNFEMDFAGRWDRYPTASNFVPKVGAKWTANEHFTFRGTFAEGFRAPALTQVSPGGVQSFTTVTDTLRCPDGVNPLDGADKVDCSKGVSSLSAANPNLANERSRSLSFGMIVTPTKNLDILIDWYRIKKVDETALLGAQTVIDHESEYPGLVVRDTNPNNWVIGADGKVIPNSGAITQVNRSYVNQGSTEVSGIDLEVTHRLPLGDLGKVTTSLNWAYLAEFRRAEHYGDVAHNLAGTRGGLSDWNTSVDDNPRNRGSLSVNWQRGDHSFTATGNYVGGVSLLRRYDNDVTYGQPYCHYGSGQPKGAYSLGGLPKYTDYFGNNCSVAAWTTFDFNYSYSGIKNLVLTFNVKNAFDRKAPYDPAYGSTSDFQGFNDQLHNGKGRYFRLTASYNFW
ncbi:TonB-dependent receptor domain-containing protein [Massilia sp. YMA4]|uniref:TonB-dependent receptor domain-containing protein n=1 Tax=Massilia sp. YMA4 TaxID=1593482 RepID=UPI000DD1684B|nr:TonB-dependent receptor [Massilia sp. YMA4]AXA92044.1 hypothetical protein DPH57_13320 [Massilia sp. YMA4]